MKLIWKTRDKEVQPGDLFYDEEGNKVVIDDPVGAPPSEKTPTGHVFTNFGVFFPSVFEMEWVE